MSYLLTLVINGLSIGAVYALIAIGFVIVFKSTNVLNFAHGSVLLAGMVVVAKLNPIVGFWVALIAGIAASAGIALLIEVLIMRRVRGADPGTLAILTIGIDVLLLTELTRQLGNEVLATGAPWGAAVMEGFGLRIPMGRVIAGVVAVVVITALGAAFKYTDWGIAMRASAADGEAASLMGIRLGRVGASAWVIAGALAAVAGLFLSSFPNAGVIPTVAVAALAAIPAWVIGGFDSVPGAVVGGLIVGLVSSITAGYEHQLTFLGRGLGEVMPYVVMILVLLFRPEGLFGHGEAHRV